jgi:hypothetical protein
MQIPYVLENNKVQGYSNTDLFTNWNKVLRGKKMF